MAQNKPDPKPEPTALEDNELSGTQEAVPVPFVTGQRKFALKWMSRVMKQYAREAPADRPGKK